MEINLTIDDFNLVCRLCLKKDKRNLQPIFKSDFSDTEQTNKSSISINRMINEFCGLQINADDGYPLLICSKCSNQLIDSHSFRTKCLESASILANIKENSDWIDFDDDVEDSKEDVHKLIADDLFFDDTKCEKEISDNNTKYLQTEVPKADLCGELNFDSKAKRRKVAEKNNKSSKVKVEKNNQKQRKKPGRKPKPKEEKAPKNRTKTSAPEICDICGILRKNMHSHYYSHLDINEVNVECDYCGKKFITKSNLLQHLRIHLNNRKFECTMCSYKFIQKAHLVRHMYTHSNEKPYKCPVCNKGFNQSGTMRIHEKSHYQNREIACPHCDKLFLTKCHLKSHIGIHTGERPFKCNICGEGFIASSTLAVHKRKHNPINPKNECDVCHQTFNNPIMLRSHKRDHGINEIKGMTNFKILAIN